MTKIVKIFPEDDITLDVVNDTLSKLAKKRRKPVNSTTESATVKDPKDKSNLK